MKRTLLATSLLSLLLSACGGDDKGLLNPPTQSVNLTAAPLTVQMSVNETKEISLVNAVTASEGIQWSLQDVSDSKGLGQISGLQAHVFNYEALTSGVTSLRYEVIGADKTASSEVLVAIEGDNDSNNAMPVAQNVSVKTLNNQDVSIDLNKFVSDVDGDALTIGQIVSNSDRFVDSGNGNITYKPNGFVGVDSAAYSVDDGHGGYDVAYIVVTSEDANPTKPNTNPTAKDINANINSSVTPVWKIDLANNSDKDTIHDSDGDKLTIVDIYAGNNRATFDGTTITYAPGDFVGIDQFTYVISDGRGGFATGTVTVTVSKDEPQNAIPVATPVVISGIADNDTRPVIIDLKGNVTDADNDAVHVVAVIGATGKAELVPGSPLEIEYTVPNPINGLLDNFSYIVTDGKGGFAMSTVTIEMVDHNPNAPIASIAQVTTQSNTPLPIDLNRYVSDGETPNAELVISNLAIKDAASDHKARVSIVGKTVTYQPNGFVGVDILTYTVSDGELSTQGYVVVTVTENGDHTFTAGDISQTIDLSPSGTTPGITIPWENKVVSDSSSGNTFTLVKAVGATLGTVSITANELTYTPTPGAFGTDQFAYIVKDSHSPAHYAQGVVTVTLTPPQAPTISELTILGTPTVGQPLESSVVCDSCSASKYQYSWVINGLVVGSESTYNFKAEDVGYNVRIEVTGEDNYGQTTNAASVYGLSASVMSISALEGSFAALKSDGAVVGWGVYRPSVAITEGVRAVISNETAFAAIKENGSVITWGNPYWGGNSAPVADQLTSQVRTAVGTRNAFAAIKDDGSVVTWGDQNYGGNSSSVDFTSGVKSIFAADQAFAAIKNDGNVVTWGDRMGGGNSNGVDFSGGVETIYSTARTFTAIKKNDTAVMWDGFGDTIIDISGGVKSVHTTLGAYAAIKNDGSVVTWGSAAQGGNSSSVDFTGGVKMIAATAGAFAALKNDGTIVVWGSSSSGADSSMVDLTQEFVSVVGNYGAFAAVKSDGSVVSWGDTSAAADSTGVVFNGEVKTIVPARQAFAAIKTDGSVVAWGAANYGGDSSGVDFSSGVHKVYSNDHAFAAIKNDGSLVTWGGSSLGGDSSGIADQVKAIFKLLHTSVN